MAVTVSGTNYLQISSCDSTTAGGTWSTMSPAADTMCKEGANSLSFICKTSGTNDMLFTPTTSKDLSGTKHLRFWFMTTNIKLLQTDALGGIQFYCTSGSTTGYWYISGNTTYKGGWYNMVIDLSRTVDSGTKPTMTAISSMGIRMILTAAGKNAANTWVDNLCYCDGLVAYGDKSGSPFSISDVFDADDATTGGWGIIRKISGVYYLVGSLAFGNTGGTATTNFLDQNNVLVFENRKVNSSLYAINVDGNATSGTSFVIGAKAGSAGTSGDTVRTEVSSQTPKWTFNSTSSNVTTMELYGSNFIDFSSFSIPESAANKEIVNCNFDSAAEVNGNSLIMKYCNFISADSHGYHISGSGFGLSDSNFVSCPYAVHFAESGTFSLSAVKFYSNTIDILNSVSASVHDSYAETNRDTDVDLSSSTGVMRAGQAFSGSVSGSLASMRFDLSKSGAPSGSMRAELYLADASSPRKPSGSVLATSDVRTANDLTTSPVNTLFVFTGDTNHYTLASGTVYFAAIYYPSGDSSNYVKVGYKATGTHDGNFATCSGSTWTGDSGKDLCFYAYRGAILTINCSNYSNPSSAKVENSGYGSTTINNAVTVKATAYDTAGSALQNVRVGIYKTADNTELVNELTNVSGVVSFAYNYSSDVPIYIRLRKTSPGSTRYINIDANGTITETGYNGTFTLIADTVANSTD